MLVYNCKAQLDWSTWSLWLTFFRIGQASSENPPSVGAANPADEFGPIMKEASSKTDLQETDESNWFHNLMVRLDPDGPIMVDSDLPEEPIVGNESTLGSVYAYVAPVDGWRLAI